MPSIFVLFFVFNVVLSVFILELFLIQPVFLRYDIFKFFVTFFSLMIDWPPKSYLYILTYSKKTGTYATQAMNIRHNLRDHIGRPSRPSKSVLQVSLCEPEHFLLCVFNSNPKH